MPWFQPGPCGPFEGDWRYWDAAVREIAELDDDVLALRHMDFYAETTQAMYAAGLIIGSPKPPEDQRKKLYADVDRLLGIS